MEYSETVEQALEYARSALGLMKENGVRTNPNNFTVWFHYFSGSYPDLKRTLDILIGNKQEFSEARSAELFQRFFTFDKESTALSDAANRIESELEKVLAYLEVAGDDTSKYGKALEDFSGSLSGSDEGADLKTVIGNVLSATRAIEQRNMDLESKLNASSEEVVQLKGDLEDMRVEASTDALTGISNRKVFDSELRRAATEAMETGEPLSLLIIDIDHFKKFNDNHGHQVGDRVLKLLAHTLTENIKGRDTAARYGGEEFSVILPNTGLKDAAKVAESIRKRVGSKHLVNRTTGADLGKLTVSIGVSNFELGEPLSQLIMRADEALYMGKRNGRDRIVTQGEVEDSELSFSG